jgi:hypothetical protein
MEILNDGGYTEDDPQPQSVIWERMNLPIARGLRGLIYVLWDLSQVDPSDLSMLFAGSGRFRIAFTEIDPPPGQDPTDAQVDEAVRRCCENPYYAFSKPVGTSLVCIQGDWSNVVDARIKGGLAAAAMGGRADSPYTPLYARGVQAPRPWGVTALFAEHTGVHQPLELHWSAASGERRADLQVGRDRRRTDPALRTRTRRARDDRAGHARDSHRAASPSRACGSSPSRSTGPSRPRWLWPAMAPPPGYQSTVPR